ncbi:MAG: hypothetical protein NC548_02650 [Lachnospiraceae bacterium]|nr:hypothetical protein [Lachnospiraceae bacterium]
MPKNGTWKEFSDAFCADENFFPAKGAEVKRRNWNSLVTEAPGRNFQMRSVQMKISSPPRAQK